MGKGVQTHANIAASAACLFTYLDVNRLTDTTDPADPLFFLTLFSRSMTHETSQNVPQGFLQELYP